MSGLEILAVAASVVQIAELGGKLSVKLFTFTRKVKNADKNIDSISQDIAATGAVLQQLGNELKKDEKLRLCSPEAIATAKSLMDECHKIFKDLNDAVDGTGKGFGSGAKLVLSLKQRVKYTFLEPQIDLLKANLEKLKSSLLVMLNVLIFAEQLKNQEALPILKDQRELLQCLVDEQMASQKQYDKVLKRLELLNVDKDGASISKASLDRTAVTSSTLTLVNTSSRSIEAPHKPDSESLIPSLPAHLHHRAEEIFDHCRLINAVIEEVNHAQYKIDLGIRYRTRELILDSHYNEWAHELDNDCGDQQHKPPTNRYNFLEHAPQLKRHWVRKASLRPTVPTQYPSLSNEVEFRQSHPRKRPQSPTLPIMSAKRPKSTDGWESTDHSSFPDFTTDQGFNLDFSTLDNSDELENFDSDSFLNTSVDDAFNFDSAMGEADIVFGGGSPTEAIEAGRKHLFQASAQFFTPLVSPAQTPRPEAAKFLPVWQGLEELPTAEDSVQKTILKYARRPRGHSPPQPTAADLEETQCRHDANAEVAHLQANERENTKITSNELALEARKVEIQANRDSLAALRKQWLLREQTRLPDEDSSVRDLGQTSIDDARADTGPMYAQMAYYGGQYTAFQQSTSTPESKEVARRNNDAGAEVFSYIDALRGRHKTYSDEAIAAQNAEIKAMIAANKTKVSSDEAPSGARQTGSSSQMSRHAYKYGSELSAAVEYAEEHSANKQPTSILGAPEASSSTKGLGGFTPSAMKRESESPRTRWGAQANTSFMRGDRNARTVKSLPSEILVTQDLKVPKEQESNIEESAATSSAEGKSLSKSKDLDVAAGSGEAVTEFQVMEREKTKLAALEKKFAESTDSSQVPKKKKRSSAEQQMALPQKQVMAQCAPEIVVHTRIGPDGRVIDALPKTSTARPQAKGHAKGSTNNDVALSFIGYTYKNFNAFKQPETKVAPEDEENDGLDTGTSDEPINPMHYLNSARLETYMREHSSSPPPPQDASNEHFSTRPSTETPESPNWVRSLKYGDVIASVSNGRIMDSTVSRAPASTTAAGAPVVSPRVRSSGPGSEWDPDAEIAGISQEAKEERELRGHQDKVEVEEKRIRKMLDGEEEYQKRKQAPDAEIEKEIERLRGIYGQQDFAVGARATATAHGDGGGGDHEDDNDSAENDQESVEGLQLCSMFAGEDPTEDFQDPHGNDDQTSFINAAPFFASCLTSSTLSEAASSPQETEGPFSTRKPRFLSGLSQHDPGVAAVQSKRPAGAGGQSPENQALQDYQLMMMMLERQNKKRSMMARQEQVLDSAVNRDGKPMPTGMGAERMSSSSAWQSQSGTSHDPVEQTRGSAQLGVLPGFPIADEHWQRALPPSVALSHAEGPHSPQECDDLFSPQSRTSRMVSGSSGGHSPTKAPTMRMRPPATGPTLHAAVESDHAGHDRGHEDPTTSGSILHKLLHQFTLLDDEQMKVVRSLELQAARNAALKGV